MMNVSISYTDEESLTVDEVVAEAKRKYGTRAKVTVLPISSMPHDMIYFALQQMVTHEQLCIFYDNKENYHSALKKLRSDVLYKVEELLDTVIIDNESKVS